MKLAFLLVAVGLGVLNSDVMAFSPTLEVNPKWMKNLGRVFEINSKRLPGDDVEFTIKVSPKGSGKIPEKSYVHLGIIQSFHGLARSSENPEDKRYFRQLKAELQDQSVVCVFTVSKKEQENPDLSFYLEFENPVRAPSAVPSPQYCESYFVQLKNFLP